MSRLTRKIRRTVEKVQTRDFTQMVTTCRRQPFRFRLSIAWMVLRGLPKPKRARPVGVEPDTPRPRN